MAPDLMPPAGDSITSEISAPAPDQAAGTESTDSMVTENVGQLLGSFATEAAAQFAVSVNPQEFGGEYYITGDATYRTGAFTYNLAPGSYTLSLHGIGSFNFAVDDNGQVNTSSPAGQAVGNSLVLNNSTVHVNPQAFAGRHEVAYVGAAYGTGERDFVVVPGLTQAYQLGIEGIGGFTFHVAANGNVISDSPAGYGVGTTLFLNNSTVHVNPQAFTWQYAVTRVGAAYGTGERDFVVVPGLTKAYELGIGGIGNFTFHVAANGNVISDSPAGYGVGTTLFLNNSTVHVNPQAYLGRYLVNIGAAYGTGERDFVVVPGLAQSYSLSLEGIGTLPFTVDGAGHISEQSPAAEASGSNLTLNNAIIIVNPDGFTGPYTIGKVGEPFVVGTHSFVLIPGFANYDLTGNAIGHHYFAVNATGQPTPSNIPVTIGSEEYVFTLTQFSPNSAPTANAGGPTYPVTYGEDVTFDGSASSDPDNDPLTYSWTINGQSAAEGVGPTLTWASLASLGVVPGNSYSVRVTVDDAHGHVVTSPEAFLVVNPAAASISVSDYRGVYDGQAHGLTGSAVGVFGEDLSGLLHLGTPLTEAGTYTVDWTFDGNANYTPASGTATMVIEQVTPLFDVASSTLVTLGTSSVSLSGTLRAGDLIPSGSVAITIDGQTRTAAIGANGAFSTSFPTDGLTVGTHTIDFAYVGDNNFTEATATGTLTATYGVTVLFNPSKAKTAGSTLPIKVELTTATGQNVSSSGVTLTALGIEATTDTVHTAGVTTSVGALQPAEDAGKANPDNLFRFEAGADAGYIYNLKPAKNLASGTYRFYFSVEDDPLFHWVTFRVK